MTNFMPSKETMAKAKVLRSPELRKILEQLESGLFLISNGISNVFIGKIEPGAQIIYRTTIRNIRTLEKAGLIHMVECEMYTEWVLSYDPKITSIKDVE